MSYEFPPQVETSIVDYDADLDLWAFIVSDGRVGWYLNEGLPAHPGRLVATTRRW